MTGPLPGLHDSLLSAVSALLGDVVELPSWQVPQTVVRRIARAIGANRVELVMVDHRLRHLMPLAGEPPLDPAAHPPELDVPGSPQGRVLVEQRVAVERTDDAAPAVVIHVPMTVRGHRLGVLTLHLSGDPGDERAWSAAAQQLAAATGLLLLQAETTTDAVIIGRRSTRFSVGAELQWSVLPPPGVEDHRFALHALVEPAARVTSDLYDWTVDGSRVWMALLDAEHEGVRAAQVGELALAALRNARRAGIPLEEQASLAGQAVHHEHRGRATVAGLLVEADLVTGRVVAVDAGAMHLLREHRGRVTAVGLDVDYPFGMLPDPDYAAQPLDLLAGDRLLLLSDGVTAAEDASGEPYGAERVARLLARPGLAASDLPRVLVAELCRYVDRELPADASCLLFCWGQPGPSA